MSSKGVAKWYSIWEIKDADVSTNWTIPLEDDSSTILVGGEYWEIDEELDGDGHLFQEVNKKMVDDPSDLLINIRCLKNPNDEVSFVQFVSDKHGDYSQGFLEINLFVDSAEFALLSGVFDESHGTYGICVYQEAPVDWYEDVPGLGPLNHVDVGDSCRIKIIRFTAFRRDETE